jgi:hypothetical protein
LIEGDIMTPDEHRLMVFMFTRQMIINRTLIEILKRSNVMQSDDYPAFEALTWEGEKVDHSNFYAVLDQYKTYAQSLGLGDDLPDEEISDIAKRPE